MILSQFFLLTHPILLLQCCEVEVENQSSRKQEKQAH